MLGDIIGVILGDIIGVIIGDITGVIIGDIIGVIIGVIIGEERLGRLGCLQIFHKPSTCPDSERPALL